MVVEEIKEDCFSSVTFIKEDSGGKAAAGATIVVLTRLTATFPSTVAVKQEKVVYV